MGRGDPCGGALGGAVPGGVAGTTLFLGPKPTARTAAEVVVSVKGCRLPESAYRNLVEDVVVEETCGLMMSMAMVTLVNPEYAFTDDAVWEEGAEMTVETGFPTTGLVRRHGKFFLMSPRIAFRGQPRITLVGFGEEVKLGLTERRRAFRKKSDADIAREVAGEHGFGTDVEETRPVHDQVLQANENDYKFLASRAQLHGFMLFAQDGVLHFHRPRPEESGVRLLFTKGQESSLSTFSAETKTFLRGAEYRVTAVDPLKLEIVDEKSRDDLDAVTRSLIQDVRGPRKWTDLVSGIGEGRPARFLVNQGHEQAVGAIAEQVQGVAESDRWVVRGKGSTFGLEEMRANQIIELIGLGKHGGRYYLTKVTHRIRGGAYNVEFEVARSFTGGSARGGCLPQATQPRRAGTVSLGA